ncbi:MAG: hypothetical protein AAFX02_00915 [Pseudomonadota bacterium]
MPLDRSLEISEAQNARDPWDLTPESDEGPSFLDVAGAAVRQGNEIGAYFSSDVQRLSEAEFDVVEEGFNPYDTERAKKIPEGFEDRFLEVTNQKQFDATKLDIDQEIEDRRNLDAAGWSGFGAELVAGVASPTSLLPGGAAIKGVRAGYSAAKSAVSVGIAAGAGAAAQELGLYRFQQTRTGEEVAVAVGGSVILGGVLGAAGAKLLTRAEFNKVSDQLEADLIEDTLSPAELAPELMRREQSAGAAAVRQSDPEDLKVGGPKVARMAAAATAAVKLHPGMEILHSPSDVTKRVGQKLFQNQVATVGQLEGRASGNAVESFVVQYEARQANFVRRLEENFSEARKAGFNEKYDTFKERVGMAARRGDVDPGGNEFISKSARDLRETVLDPAKKEAIRVGLLPEELAVDTAVSYLHRVWNTDKIIARAPEFKELLRDYFGNEVALAKAAGKADEFVTEADMKSYVNEIVDSVFNNITGRARTEMPDWIVPAERGPLKARTLKISDEIVEQFLESDVERVSEVYTRRIAPDIELTRAFGSPDMEEAFDDINADYERLIEAANTDAERAKLNDSQKRDVKILTDFRNMLRNNYRVEETTSDFGLLTRVALFWNYVRLLGGQAISSLPEAAAVLTKQGMSNFMTDAMPALTSNVRAARISRQDAKDFVTILETVFSARMSALADIGNPYASGRVADRLMDNIANQFFRFTGINWLNANLKQAVAVQTMNRLAKNLSDAAVEVPGRFGDAGYQMDYSKLSKHWRSFMGKLEISEDIGARAFQQINKHGAQENGIWGLNLGRWDDLDAKREIIAAITKESDQTVVTPRVADRPLWTRSNWGKVMMQFKGHALAAHGNVMISRLQGPQRHFAEFMVMATTLGMMVSYFKYLERGDTEGANRLLDNPGLLISEGVDRTGFIPVLMEASNTLEGLGSPFGIKNLAQALAGDEDRDANVSRFAGRNVASLLAGPTAGVIQDLALIASESASGEISKSGANAVLRQIPGGTLPGLRTVLQEEVKPALLNAVE